MQAAVRIALDWAIRAFGYDHVYNLPIRTLRIAEEAVELVQSQGIDKATMLRVVDVVYSRPPGRMEQELGGVLMTVNVLCAAASLDPEAVFITELMRVLAKSPAHFTKRNQEKIDLGLTAGPGKYSRET